MNYRLICKALAACAFSAAAGAGDARAAETSAGAVARTGAASEGEAGVAGDAARLTYTPDFFADYNPQTAREMVARIPGFSISGGGGGRGLAGNLGNVLIDGRRPSSKDGVGALLSRIPAATVLRIELIREPLPEIDMAGRDQVVNVITDRAGGWSGAWSARARLFESGRVTPAGEFSATRTAPQSTLTVSLNLSSHADGSDRERAFAAFQGAGLGRERERVQESFHDLTPSLAWRRDFEAGHALRVDARVWTWRYTRGRQGRVFDETGALDAFETGRSETLAHGGEATVDYDHVLTEAWSVKLTGLQRLDSDEGDDLFEDFDVFGAFDGRVTIADAETQGETVLRAELRRSAQEADALTLSAEGAYNFLDGSIEIFEDAGSGPVRVDLPVSDTRVEEHRVDLAARRSWDLASRWTLEGALGVEFSRIAQTGDAEKERTFTYFKPEMTATWTPGERDQLRFTAERAVGQLSFGDFISSVDVRDDTSQLGNPELEPERTWRVQADWERRFSQTGVVTLLVRHEWVEGVEDLVPVAGLFDAPGNLPEGRRWRVQGGFTAPLDALGVTGGELSASAMYRDTRVDDPVTGAPRRFRGDEDWRARFDFRQDLPQAGFAWGVDYYVQGLEDFYRLDAFDRVTPPRGDLDLFAETRRFAGLTARIGADLNLDRQERERLIWPVSRAQGDPEQTEVRTVDFDGRLYVELNGVF